MRVCTAHFSRSRRFEIGEWMGMYTRTRRGQHANVHTHAPQHAQQHTAPHTDTDVHTRAHTATHSPVQGRAEMHMRAPSQAEPDPFPECGVRVRSATTALRAVRPAARSARSSGHPAGSQANRAIDRASGPPAKRLADRSADWLAHRSANQLIRRPPANRPTGLWARQPTERPTRNAWVFL